MKSARIYTSSPTQAKAVVAPGGPNRPRLPSMVWRAQLSTAVPDPTRPTRGRGTRPHSVYRFCMNVLSVSAFALPFLPSLIRYR